MMFRFAFVESEKYNSGEKTVQGVVPGWFMGRKMDLSDSQWNMLRSHMPVLVLGMSSFLFLSDLVRKTGSAAKRVLFYNAVSLFFIVILHGVAACWLLLVSIANCIFPPLLPPSSPSLSTFVLYRIALIIHICNHADLTRLAVPALRGVGIQSDDLVDVLL